MSDRIPSFLLRKTALPEVVHHGRRVRQSVVDQGIHKFSALVISLTREEDVSIRRGLFPGLDARVKILFLVFFIVIVSLEQTIQHEAVIALFLLVLAILSRIPLGRFYLSITGFTFFFGFLVACPATLNVITPGELLWPIVSLERAYDVWIYHVPRKIGFTVEGLEVLTMLCLRIMNSLSVSFLVLYTTPLTQIIRALQVFRIPAAFLLIVTLSLKYMIVFSRNVEDMYLARKSRSLTAARGQAARLWVAGRIEYLFRKTGRRYEEIYRAMTARGYTHDYRQPHFGGLAMADRVAFGILLLSGLGILIW